MSEESRPIDVVVSVVRAVGDHPIEEYALSLSHKATIDKIHNKLFGEVDWLVDKKDEYKLCLPDGAPLSVYFHRIGEVASVMAIHRAGQKPRLLLLPINQQAPRPQHHQPMIIPKLSLHGGLGSPSAALSLSPRGIKSPPRSPLGLVGSPRRHSFYPTSAFSVADAEPIGGEPRDSEEWRKMSSGQSEGESEDRKRAGSALKRSSTQDESVEEEVRSTKEENEALKYRLQEMEQRMKALEEKLEIQGQEFEKERQELLKALAITVASTIDSHDNHQGSTVSKIKRTSSSLPSSPRTKEEKVKIKGHKLNKSDAAPGVEPEESSTPKKKSGKHKTKKSTRSLKLSEVKGLMSPKKGRKGSQTWENGPSCLPDVESHENEADKVTSPEKKSRTKKRGKTVSKESLASEERSSESALPTEMERSEQAPTKNSIHNLQAFRRDSATSSNSSSFIEGHTGSFVIVVQEDARIDEEDLLMDSGSEIGSGVKTRSSSVASAGLEPNGNGSAIAIKGSEDEDATIGEEEDFIYESDGEYEPFTASGTIAIRKEKDLVQLKQLTESDENHLGSEEDSGREEWEGGNGSPSSRRKRALRFAKTETTWSELRRTEKKKWLKEKKERTRTSRWEELIKEQQETLKALQQDSCEMSAIMGLASSERSDLTRSAGILSSPGHDSIIRDIENMRERSASNAEITAPPKLTSSGNEVPVGSIPLGNVQTYKAHQIRRLWHRRRNTMPRTLEELAAEYTSRKKDLDERARKWQERRRERGEPPELDEQEMERERNERKAKRKLAWESSGELSHESYFSSGEALVDEHRTRQKRSSSLAVKRNEDATEDEQDLPRPTDSPVLLRRKKHASGDSPMGRKKSGSMIAAASSPKKDKITDRLSATSGNSSHFPTRKKNKEPRKLRTSSSSEHVSIVSASGSDTASSSNSADAAAVHGS